MKSKSFFILSSLLPLFILACPVTIDQKSGAPGNDNSWIVGKWVDRIVTAPHSEVFSFSADGVYTLYDDYDETIVSGSTTWSLDGDILTFTGWGSAPVTKINDNQFSWPGKTFYRKGFQPDGLIFDSVPVNLDMDATTDGSIPVAGMSLYSFDATSGITYNISIYDDWEDDPDVTDEAAFIAAYHSDKDTVYFEDRDKDYEENTLTPAIDESVYLVVYGMNADNEGTFDIGVTDD